MMFREIVVVILRFTGTLKLCVKCRDYLTGSGTYIYHVALNGSLVLIGLLQNSGGHVI